MFPKCSSRATGRQSTPSKPTYSRLRASIPCHREDVCKVNLIRRACLTIFLAVARDVGIATDVRDPGCLNPNPLGVVLGSLLGEMYESAFRYVQVVIVRDQLP